MQFKSVAYENQLHKLLKIRREIVGCIEVEEKIFEVNRELIRIYEAKIKKVIVNV